MKNQNVERSNDQRDRWTNGIWIPIVTIFCILFCGFLWMNSYKKSKYQNEDEGSITVINDNFQIMDSIVCKEEYCYDINVNTTLNDNSLHLIHGAPSQSRYAYFFTILGEGMTIKGRLDFIEATDDLHENWNIVIDIQQVDGVWNATVTSPDGTGSCVVCTDIEKNGIILGYASEANKVELNSRVDAFE